MKKFFSKKVNIFVSAAAAVALGFAITAFIISTYFSELANPYVAPKVHNPSLEALATKEASYPAWTISGGKLNVFGYTLAPSKMRPFDVAKETVNEISNKEYSEEEYCKNVNMSFETSPGNRYMMIMMSNGCWEEELWLYDSKSKKQPVYVGFREIKHIGFDWFDDKVFSITEYTSTLPGARYNLYRTKDPAGSSKTIDDLIWYEPDRDIYIAGKDNLADYGKHVLEIGKAFDPAASVETTEVLLGKGIIYLCPFGGVEVKGEKAIYTVDCDGLIIKNEFYPKLLKR